jgi:hypothetical protein
MVSPDSKCPPGDETITSMGSAESASNAIKRRAVSAAVASEIFPKMSTVRDLNAFSSKKALRGSIGAVGGVVSIKILLTYLTNEAPGS